MSELEDPVAQIRERTYTIDTTSLVESGNEPVPEEIVRDLLTGQWMETQATPRPRIIVEDEQIQINTQREDVVAISISQYQENYIDHRHEYVSINIPVEILIATSNSRQRMWNIMAEIRRIIYKWAFALRPYQTMSFDSFRPDYNGPNQYSGVVSMTLSAEAIPIIRRVIAGMETPSTDPEDFTKNETLGVS